MGIPVYTISSAPRDSAFGAMDRQFDSHFLRQSIWHNSQQPFTDRFSKITLSDSSLVKEVNMTFVRSFVGLMILRAGLATPAAAQGTADIVGRLTDPGGGALPGATVTARDLGTNITRTSATSDTGDYTFTALPVGEYEVKTELSGFRPQT